MKDLFSIEENLRLFRIKKQPFIAERNGKELEFLSTAKRVQKIEVQNALTLCQYLIEAIRLIYFSRVPKERSKVIKMAIEEAYFYTKTVMRLKISKEEKEALKATCLAMKMGGKVPISYLLAKKNSPFRKFIENNYLHHAMFFYSMQVPFDSMEGPLIPICREDKSPIWAHFNHLLVQERQNKLIFQLDDEEVFVTDKNMVLDANYTFLYQGIQKYDIAKSTHWIPFDVQDPKEWGQKHVAEVWAFFSKPLENNPRMFRSTHAYLILKDSEGNVRSVGQDVIMTIKDYKLTELLSVKNGSGKILTPDISVFYPKHSRHFEMTTFHLTKKQHDKIIEIVESDKRNENHTISVMRGNCVSYVLKLLRKGADIQLDASIHAFHIFSRSLLPYKIYEGFFRPFDRWYNRQSKMVQRAVFFFPPFYICHILFGFIALACKRRNYENRADFFLKDIFLRPWTMSCDHPHQLVKILSSVENSSKTIDTDEDQVVV